MAKKSKPPPPKRTTYFPQVPIDVVKKSIIEADEPKKDVSRPKNVVREQKTEPYTRLPGV